MIKTFLSLHRSRQPAFQISSIFLFLHSTVLGHPAQFIMFYMNTIVGIPSCHDLTPSTNVYLVPDQFYCRYYSISQPRTIQNTLSHSRSILLSVFFHATTSDQPSQFISYYVNYMVGIPLCNYLKPSRIVSVALSVCSAADFYNKY